MNNYDNLEMLEFFDSHVIHDESAGIETYTVASTHENTQLNIFIIACEHSVSFNLRNQVGTLVDFGIRNLTAIKCDKNEPKVVRFLFYRNNNSEPVVTVTLQPRLNLVLNFEKG